MNKLKYLLSNPAKLKGGVEVMKILLPLSLKELTGKMPSTDCYATSKHSIDREKEEFLLRLNCLCEKIILSPEQLLYSYQKILGDYYGPQWSIYECVMLIASLSNVARIWPELQKKCLSRIEKLLPILLSEEIRRNDAKECKEDPLTSLSCNKDHFSICLLAWSISLYRFTGGNDNSDFLFKNCCGGMNSRMRRSRDLNLKTFPNRPIFFPDMLMVIVALENYGKLYDNRYEGFVKKWIIKCKNEWLNKKSGLISAFKYIDKTKGLRGSYISLSNFLLTLIDEEFALD